MLPEKKNSNSHGAKPVHQIILMVKWIRNSRLSTKNTLFIPGLSESQPILTHLVFLHSELQKDFEQPGFNQSTAPT